jgi:hypothetical protein
MKQRRITGAMMMASTMKTAMEVKRRPATDSIATGHIWNL